MDGDERTPLSDDALDRALEEVLEVRPSADFQARIRSHVAAGRHRRQWSAAWQATAVAASLLLVIGAALVSRLGDGPKTTPARPEPLVAAAPADAMFLAPAPDAASGFRPGARSTAATLPVAPSQTRAASGVLAEVVISEAERKGFELLLAQLRRNALPPVSEAPEPETNTIAPAPISIEAIVLDSFPSFDSLEGETR
jgi:hypothetical protein